MLKFVLHINPLYRWLLLLAVAGLVLIISQNNWVDGFNPGGIARHHLPVERPLIVYLGFDEKENNQLYTVSPATGEVTQLTQMPEEVGDHVVSPGGITVAFSVWRDDGGSDLWAVSLENGKPYPLLTCPGVACSGPLWTPDGTRLLYEQRLLLFNDTLGPPRLWWLNPTTGQTDPVFAGEMRYGFAAGLSADGQWLSYLLPDNRGVQIYNLADGRGFVFPSQTGERPVWHPQANLLLVTHFSPGEEEFATHILQVDPAQGSWTDLSGANNPVEDGAPAWSPGGGQLAFTRKPALVSMGRQIWLMQLDDSESPRVSSEPQYLTSEPEFYHGRPVWSPDGAALVFHRFSLQDPAGVAGIWLLDVAGGSLQELVSSGRQPQWLP